MEARNGAEAGEGCQASLEDRATDPGSCPSYIKNSTYSSTSGASYCTRPPWSFCVCEGVGGAELQNQGPLWTGAVAELEKTNLISPTAIGKIGGRIPTLLPHFSKLH